MPETQIDEPIKVLVFFDNSNLKPMLPVAMTWRRRFIKFKKLVFLSVRRIGDIKITNMVCASDTGNFELEYNGDNHLWKLKKVMIEE